MLLRGSPFWGVLMGAVGLTFVIVAVFLGVIAGRGGQLPPGEPTAAPILAGSVTLTEADPSEVAPLDAGSPPADAGSPDADAEDAGPDDAEAPESAASAPLSSGKKTPGPLKPKPKPKPRPKHH